MAKHGVIGLMRCMHQALKVHKVPVRINAVAPSWTGSGLVPEKYLTRLGIFTQSPDVVARAAAGLMVDKSRSGHLIHVDHGIYKEVDEAVFLPAYDGLPHPDTANEDDSMGMMWDVINGRANAES